MSQFEDHPKRYALANELHARPFPSVAANSTALYLAIKRGENAVGRDRALDLAHLTDLLDRFGAPHPQPGATHWFGELGRHKLKWEQHTEFVTYTLFSDRLEDRPFDPATFDLFPSDWLDRAPGQRMTSAIIRIELEHEEDAIAKKLHQWFVPESLAASYVLEGTAVVGGDFRIDTSGHMRFAVFARKETGPRRIGRIVQRLCEIETYKTMSMLGLSRARDMGARMGELDVELTQLISGLRGEVHRADETLDSLLSVSAELENMLAQSAFRFGATGAYEALVNQRIKIMREQRFLGRQTFSEFMMRRFDPAMRTAKSTESRLKTMAERAIRAGDLLRTRVDVERSAQNQSLLESMDKRADVQLRLQRTVEGLSVVAISYYAVNLALYVLAPLGEGIGVSKLIMGAIVTPLVILLVWFAVRRIRQSVEK
jgi:uncharacterized membrane-anchored protein